jgi:hypothetical protein
MLQLHSSPTALVTAIICGALTLLTGLGGAQARLELPRKSPAAVVMQRVGLTDVTVKYHRPAVRKRRVFGKLVPYGKLWRTGANACTKLILSRPATIGGSLVAPGTYSVLTIPGRGAWTVIVNKNTKLWGTRGYKQAHDVARFKVKSKAAPFRERLTFVFSGVTERSARLDLWWARRYVSIPIRVETNKQALATIGKQTKRGWYTYAAAARYLLETKQQPARALKLINQALAADKTWYGSFIKARILHWQKRHGAAYAMLQQAKTLGDKDKRFFYKAQVEKALKAWKRR